jgi:uncharacterized protein with GYD domain
MATYISLCRFTDQGIRSVKDTTQRATAVKDAARKFGVEMTHIYWTLGQYDLITTIEATDEQAATAFGLAIGAAGNIRLETLRAYNADEMNAILGKLP